MYHDTRTGKMGTRDKMRYGKCMSAIGLVFGVRVPSIIIQSIKIDYTIYMVDSLTTAE